VINSILDEGQGSPGWVVETKIGAGLVEDNFV
jgi:hypothetical protein